MRCHQALCMGYHVTPTVQAYSKCAWHAFCAAGARKRAQTLDAEPTAGSTCREAHGTPSRPDAWLDLPWMGARIKLRVWGLGFRVPIP